MCIARFVPRGSPFLTGSSTSTDMEDCDSQTMTVGTSFGVAGQPCIPWNSAAWSRTSGAISDMGMGSMAIWGLHGTHR